MQVSVESTSALGRAVKVVVPAESVSEKKKEIVRDYSKNAKLKGFRDKIPYSFIEKKFANEIKQAVQKEIVNKSFSDALIAEKLDPITTPDIKEVKHEGGIEYTAEFEIRPSIELTDFKALEFDLEKVSVKSSDVDKMVEKLKLQHANWNVVDAASKEENRLKVDFKRTLVEKDASEEVENNKYIIIGAKGVLAELNKELVGKKAGDVVETTLTYPKDWADTSVANKKYNFVINVHEVSEQKILSDEELIKLFSVEGGMDALRSDLESRMNEEASSVVFSKSKEKVLDKILSLHKFDLPQALVEQEMTRAKAEIAQKLGKPAAAAGDIDENEVKEQANRSVALGLLLSEVISKYGVKADPKKIRARIERLALMYPNPEQIIQAYYSNERLLASVENEIVLDAAVEKIISEAIVNDIDTSFAKVIERDEVEAV